MRSGYTTAFFWGADCVSQFNREIAWSLSFALQTFRTVHELA